MHSKYLGYSMWIKATAFIPTVIGFVTFFVMIAVYGRIQPSNSTSSTSKPEETNKTIEL